MNSGKAPVPHTKFSAMKILTRRQILLSFILHNKALSLTALLCGLFANFFVILLPVSLGKYFELLFGVGSRRAHYLEWLPGSWWADIPSFLAFFFTLIFLRTVFHFLQRYSTGLLGERFSQQVREQLFAHQLRVNTAIYDQKGIGKYLLRYSGDMQSLQKYLTAGMVQFAVDLLLLLIAFGFLLWLNLVIMLVMTAGVALTLTIMHFLNKKLYATMSKRRNSRSLLLSFINSRLMTSSTIKAFNKEVTEIQKFEKKSNELYKRGRQYQKVYGLIYALGPGLIYAVLGIALWAIYRQYQNGVAFDSGAMLAFVLLFITILPVLRRIIRVNTVWKTGSLSFEKLLAVLYLEAEEKNRQVFKFKKGKIEFRKLGFGFSKKDLLFKELNLSIQPGRITVLTAPSGFGKTTLIKLLMGIYPVQSGQLLIDGQDLSTVDYKTLRRNISAVSDGFYLLGKTVFEAISYSRKTNKREEAARILNALQTGMPDPLCLTLDDEIGDLGARLSGGQRKLLQYARAFLTQKPVLLIDEPFTDLPDNIRVNITRLLLEKKEQRTTLLLTSQWNNDWLQPNAIFELDKPMKPRNALHVNDAITR